MTDRSERPSNRNPYVLPNVWKAGAPTPFISVPSTPGTSPRIQSSAIRPVPRPTQAARAATPPTPAARTAPAAGLGSLLDPYVGLTAASPKPKAAPQAATTAAESERPPAPPAPPAPAAPAEPSAATAGAPSASAPVPPVMPATPQPAALATPIAEPPAEVRPARSRGKLGNRTAITRYGTYGALAAAVVVVAVGAFVMGRSGHPGVAPPATKASSTPASITAGPATVTATAAPAPAARMPAKSPQPPERIAAAATASTPETIVRGRTEPRRPAPPKTTSQVQLASALANPVIGVTPAPGATVSKAAAVQPILLATAPPPLVLPPAIAVRTPPVIAPPAAGARTAAVDPNAPIVTNSPEKQ